MAKFVITWKILEFLKSNSYFERLLPSHATAHIHKRQFVSKLRNLLIKNRRFFCYEPMKLKIVVFISKDVP